MSVVRIPSQSFPQSLPKVLVCQASRIYPKQMRKLCTGLYVLQGLTVDRIQISYEPIWEKKGTQLNKCLCKAHVCGVIMVNVLLISEGTKMSAAVRGLYIKWYYQNCSWSYCNGGVTEFCSSVCISQQSAGFAVCKSNAALGWSRKPQAGASVTVCNKTATTTHSQWLSGVIYKMFDHLLFPVQSAWQNLKVQVCCSPFNFISTSP